MPHVSEATRVNIILPLTARDIDGCSAFLENFTRFQVSVYLQVNCRNGRKINPNTGSAAITVFVLYVLISSH